MIHHISHIDLDGYTCSHIVASVHTDPDTLRQTNVDYGELTEHLITVLSAVDPVNPLEELLITDLNLKTDAVDAILQYRDRYRLLTLIDHHQNDEREMDRLDENVNCRLVLDPAYSATWLTAHHLCDEQYLTGSFLALVEIVDAYDMYQVGDTARFPLGYVLNEWFMDVINQARPVLAPEGVRILSNELLSFYKDISLELQIKYPAAEVCDLLYQLLMESIHVDIPERFRDIGLIDPDRYHATDNAVHCSAYPQRVAALLAAAGIGPHGIAQDYLIEIDDVTLLMSPVKLPRGVLFQLMYTLGVVDIHVMMTDSVKGRVEFRQHKLKPHVDLSQVAHLWGGGGHIGAAGCHTQQGWTSFEPEVIEILTKQLRKLTPDE